MIDLSGWQPRIEWEGGEVVLEVGWLRRLLEQAARAAGYGCWLPAEHVAEAVAAHWGGRRVVAPVSRECFLGTVREVLAGIGYAEVAPHFWEGGVDVEFSLLSLVSVRERAARGFELGFWGETGSVVERLCRGSRGGRVALVDVVPAVKSFLGRERWCGECERFREGFVEWVRGWAVKCARQGGAALFISVQ
ncbi:MAG: hypothetical protein RLZZ142_2657 [Verrucomicrobiota bacterium]